MKLRPEEITSILKQRIEEFDQHGGTQGSPVSPLLNSFLRSDVSWAALGRSLAPPSSSALDPTV